MENGGGRVHLVSGRIFPVPVARKDQVGKCLEATRKVTSICEELEEKSKGDLSQLHII